jgi:galactose mutarotase-like enzyme
MINMPPCIHTFDASRFQALREGHIHQSGNVTITHTGNRLAEVHMAHGDASLTVTLRKGGAIVSTLLRGQELFEQDHEYGDLSQVTRTKGTPNIFPVFNQMPEGVVLEGAQAPLPNHGIARHEPWQACTSPDLPGMLVLRLTSSEHTKKYYPYAFTYTQCIALEPTHLTIEQHIETEGAFSVGFHPYFRVGHKQDIAITGIDAGTPYWYLPNALSKREKDAIIAADRSLRYVPGKAGSLNFTMGEVNHHFDMAGQHHDIVITDPGLHRRIILQRTAACQGLTIWSEAQASAVCVEPVTDRSGRLSPKPSPWVGRVCVQVEAL